MKKTLLFLLLTVFLGEINAQTSAGISRNSWEWKGHNNWFLPTGNEGNILNQTTGVVTKVQDPGTAWDDKIRGYQGVTCASDDNGNLLFFSNGNKAWRADGSLITDNIWAGSECGAQFQGNSAAHGVMTITHPLTPNKYYIITIDDIVAQGFSNGEYGQHGNKCNSPGGFQVPVISHGISYAVIDSSANLVHSSIAIERDITSGQQGQLRTTEDMAATFHANGVDIWITFHPLWAKHVVSYLLTCDGFVTPPVVSGEGLVPYVDIQEGIGGLDFTQDGKRLAVGVEINTKNLHGQLDSKNAYGTINLYDFDNKTGVISNRLAVHNSEWISSPIYNVFFGPTGKWLHYSGTFLSYGGKVDISSENEATIRGTKTTSVELNSAGFNGAAMTYDGSLKTSNNVYEDAGIRPRYSSNSMYIPPSEEPDIIEVGPLCDTASSIDLSTFWIGSGLSAEDTLYQRHSYFLLDSNDVSGVTYDANSASIIGEKTGIFDPKKAGKGTHKIVFTYCAVDDTIDIVVNSCAGTVTNIGNVFKSINQVKVYPNPTSKNLIVAIENPSNVFDLNVSILDIQNNVVHQGRVKGSTQSIDVNNWAAGIYFVHILDGTKTLEIRKVVVNN